MIIAISCCYGLVIVWFYIFFFKQKTAYEMRISDWSSDVCSSDLKTHIAETPVELYQRLTEGSERLPILDDVQVTIVNTREKAREVLAKLKEQIGRASCRERVCQYV